MESQPVKLEYNNRGQEVMSTEGQEGYEDRLQRIKIQYS